jgi:hypothetical protein
VCGERRGEGERLTGGARPSVGRGREGARERARLASGAERSVRERVSVGGDGARGDGPRIG